MYDGSTNYYLCLKAGDVPIQITTTDIVVKGSSSSNFAEANQYAIVTMEANKNAKLKVSATSKLYK